MANTNQQILNYGEHYPSRQDTFRPPLRERSYHSTNYAHQYQMPLGKMFKGNNGVNDFVTQN